MGIIPDGTGTQITREAEANVMRQDRAPWVQLTLNINMQGSQEQIADAARRLGTALRGIGNIEIKEAD